ncbi:MAG TPA: putative quinol monooxygenase [Bryobacteraceae bacterium]|jgi:quinol monooxygenase YgiN|nr:putative quinol monooxygenase [Bryobacteraceae bacterium]
MQIGGLKTILVKEGHEQEFEGLFGELRAAMGHSEPDCLYYSLLKSRTNPRAYIVEEQYRNQAAFDLHQSSEYGKIYFPKIRAILESIEVEYYDVIVP